MSTSRGCWRWWEFAATPVPKRLCRQVSGTTSAVLVAGAIVAIAGLHVHAVIDTHAAYLETSRVMRAGVAVAFEPGGLICQTSPYRVNELTSDIAYLPPPSWLRELLGEATTLDPPSWVTSNWRPSDELIAEVRHIMCETPAGPDA